MINLIKIQNNKFLLNNNNNKNNNKNNKNKNKNKNMVLYIAMIYYS